jgi:hypothetical protein
MRIRLFVVLSAAVVCFAYPAFAVENQVSIPVSTHLTTLQKELSLSADQVKKIAAIMSESYPELNPTYKISDAERLDKIREHNKRANDRIDAILSPAQRTKYEATKAKKKQLYATALHQSMVDDMAKKVGLSKNQKTSVSKILLDYKQKAHEASDIPVAEDIDEGKTDVINKIRKERDSKIEALLSPVQVKKYRAFLKAGKSVPNYRLN